MLFISTKFISRLAFASNYCIVRSSMIIPVFLISCFISCVVSETIDYAEVHSALMTLYTHTGGKIVSENPFFPEFKYSEDPLLHGWRRVKNWGSNLPFSEWEGITTAANDDNDIVEISLYENNLRNDISFEMFGTYMPHLTRLDLCFNNFSTTAGQPPGVKLPFGSALGDTIELLKHTSITELHLSGNKLSGYIPSSIGSLTSLEKLQISYSKLTGSLPESLGNLRRLTHLDLSENNLTGSLPKSLRYLTKLKVLYLNHNSALRAKEKVIRAKLPNIQWVNV